jgi:uncharacterized membrane protein YcaP (DUF421 family)
MKCLYQKAGHKHLSDSCHVGTFFVFSLNMDWISIIWGEGEHLNALQMAVRAFVMFFIALVMIRLGGMRIFSKKSAFDTIIVIMLGAVLARGIVGASDYWATVAASAVMIAINRGLAWLSEIYTGINNVIKGKALILYESGEICWENMKTASLTRSDLMESLRLETQQESLDHIEKVYMETNGRISFIMKESK